MFTVSKVILKLFLRIIIELNSQNDDHEHDCKSQISLSYHKQFFVTYANTTKLDLERERTNCLPQMIPGDMVQI